MKWIGSIVTGFVFLYPLLAVGAEDDDGGGLLWGVDTVDSEFVEPGKGQWRESLADLPPYPDFGKMLALPLNHFGSAFRYFVDPNAFSVSEKDGVTRYTVIIESRSGVRNVLYEGIRCEFDAYRTIATGSADKTFHLMTEGPWLTIQKEGVMAYRWVMVEQYFCDAKLSVPADQIADRIRYDEPTYNGLDENF